MKWTEESLREYLTEKTGKWEEVILKWNESWRLLFAYPVFLITFMAGSCFNDYLPFFLTATAVFIYIFVKNVLRCLISKEKIRFRIVVGGLILLLYVFYCIHFWK